MAHHLRIANAGVEPRQIGDWADTETAQDIRRSLELVWASDGPSLTMIVGTPGTGKTTSIERFQKEHPFECRCFSVKSGENRPSDVSEILFRDLIPWEKPNGLSLPSRRDLISTKLHGGMLVFDDAHFLKADTIDWIRGLSEETGTTIVFVGAPELARNIAATPQLQSRLIRPVVIRQVSRADVASVLDGTAFADPHSIDVLHGLSLKHGGLRNVENVTRIATMFAGNQTPGPEHLKAAIIDMKLDGKRGQ